MLGFWRGLEDGFLSKLHSILFDPLCMCKSYLRDGRPCGIHRLFPSFVCMRRFQNSRMASRGHLQDPAARSSRPVPWNDGTIHGRCGSSISESPTTCFKSSWSRTGINNEQDRIILHYYCIRYPLLLALVVAATSTFCRHHMQRERSKTALTSKKCELRRLQGLMSWWAFYEKDFQFSKFDSSFECWCAW